MAKDKLSLDFQLILVGCADLRAVSRALIAKINEEVTSLIFAPEGRFSLFDQMGCLIGENWLNVDYEVPERMLQVVNGPTDQAQAVLNFLSRVDKNVTSENIIIGSCDRDIAPYLKEHIEREGISIRESAGKSILATRPGSLLSLIAKYLATHLYPDLAALLRHPDFELWYLQELSECSALTNIQNTSVIALLDDFQAEHLQARIVGDRIGNDHHWAPLLQLLKKVEQLFSGFSATRRSFDYWGKVISALLTAIYGNRNLNRNDDAHREIIEACEAIYEALVELDSALAKAGVELEGRDALGIVVNRIARQRVSLPHHPEALEMLGWLELSLDDAEALAVVGMNEGRVPEVINADKFLPNRLRKALKIVDNDTRFVRDLYLLLTLINSKKEVIFIAGQRDSRGEGLLLSRLMLSKDDEKLSQQILKIGLHQEKIVPSKGGRIASEVIKCLPRPDMTGRKIDSIHVTAFRDYLRCPYRFYLKHVLRLKEIDDQVVELNARQFGVIIHEALNAFANSKYKNSIDEFEIVTFLCAFVDNFSRKEFGPFVYPVIRAQVFYLKERFRFFAKWQVGHRKAGWEIKYSEVAFNNVSLPVCNSELKITINARVDRIDFNPKSNEWLIIDYKTGDKAIKPQAQHQRKGEWVDLQLPVYRDLFITQETKANVGVGYVCLPANEEMAGCYIADWQEDDYDDARRIMTDVLGKISRHEFWPPNLDSIAFDEYDRIVGMIRSDYELESDEEIE